MQTPHQTAHRAGSGSWLATKLYYGVGAVAYGVKDNGFSYFLLIYYNQVLGLPPTWVGGAIFIALLFDAISDPIVGHLSDNLHSRWGRRHPFMYGSLLPVAVSFWLLWNPPSGLEREALFIYLVIVAISVRTFITFYEIPSSSLAPEMSDDYDERTSMMSYRYFFGWWGGLTIAVVALGFMFGATDAYPNGLLNPAGWQIYGLTSAIIIAVAAFASSAGTHRQIPYLRDPPARERPGVRASLAELRETLSNRSFLVLLGSGVFAAMAAGLSTSLNIYFNTYFWELQPQTIALITMGPFLSSTIALVAAPMLSRRVGKKAGAISVWLIATVAAPLPILGRIVGWMPDNGTAALVAILFVFAVVEVALIVTSSILISAMVADIVEESELATGRRSEGVFFAARSFIGKAVHGVGVVSATLLLTAVGFPEDAKPGEVDPAVIVRLGLVYAPSLVAMYAIAIAFLGGYKISRASFTANLEKLSAEAEDAPKQALR